MSFPRDSRTDGTLRLKIASGRGPQLQAMSDVIIDRVNANFGYRAIKPDQSGSNTLNTGATIAKNQPPAEQTSMISGHLMIKLKDVKSPELRAALGDLAAR
ncbi:MAG: hypothetical protein CM15mP46_2060 [Alphaproteobacteria bacterium]|nr:MAG: hypothetical protein CM15mP46_2060 [Alphaproteobacteria bacterium]